jgi:hypothetical protein
MKAIRAYSHLLIGRRSGRVFGDASGRVLDIHQTNARCFLESSPPNLEAHTPSSHTALMSLTTWDLLGYFWGSQACPAALK